MFDTSASAASTSPFSCFQPTATAHERARQRFSPCRAMLTWSREKARRASTAAYLRSIAFTYEMPPAL